ncbi:MAG: hypothetical protein VKN72_17460, partial [Nostocales cyanobacterium 94392]|nr:hypothetical protein [Nostocales cyanobacterium 94392]
NIVHTKNSHKNPTSMIIVGEASLGICRVFTQHLRYCHNTQLVRDTTNLIVLFKITLTHILHHKKL